MELNYNILPHNKDFNKGILSPPFVRLLCEDSRPTDLSSSLTRFLEINPAIPIMSSSPHLLFADDILLFREASSQTIIMENILHQFYNISRLKVSLCKSKLCVSRNISTNAQLALSRQIGIPLSQDLRMYLSLPLLHNRVTKNTFNYLANKVRKKLGGWKGKLLSWAIKAVLRQFLLLFLHMLCS